MNIKRNLLVLLLPLLTVADGAAAQVLSPATFAARAIQHAESLSLSSSSSRLDRSVRLTIRGRPLREALEGFSRAADLPLVYSPSQLDGLFVTYECPPSGGRAALDELLVGTPFRAVDAEDGILIERVGRTVGDAGPTILNGPGSTRRSTAPSVSSVVRRCA